MTVQVLQIPMVDTLTSLGRQRGRTDEAVVVKGQKGKDDEERHRRRHHAFQEEGGPRHPSPRWQNQFLKRLL